MSSLSPKVTMVKSQPWWRMFEPQATALQRMPSRGASFEVKMPWATITQAQGEDVITFASFSFLLHLYASYTSSGGCHWLPFAMVVHNPCDSRGCRTENQAIESSFRGTPCRQKQPVNLIGQ